jgi:hypothetical protein
MIQEQRASSQITLVWGSASRRQSNRVHKQPSSAQQGGGAACMLSCIRNDRSDVHIRRVLANRRTLIQLLMFALGCVDQYSAALTSTLSLHPSVQNNPAVIYSIPPTPPARPFFRFFLAFVGAVSGMHICLSIPATCTETRPGASSRCRVA